MSLFAAFCRLISKWILPLDWRALKRSAAILVSCAGIGLVSALAPFGIARMRPGQGIPPDSAFPRALEPARSPEEAVAEILQARFLALVDGDTSHLEAYYDAESDTGLWSLEKECLRVDYLHKWVKARGVEVTGAKARIEIDSVSPEGADSAWVEVTEHAAYTYSPVHLPSPTGDGDWVHTFGSRAVHVLELVLRDGDWRIRRDWYADPIAHEAYLPPCAYEIGPQPAPGTAPLPQADEAHAGLFDRERAREYAVRYAGVPAIEGSGKYNSSFRVYTFVGGDCANFASQVLEAGGLPQGHGWHYTSEGSAAWVRGEDLVWHLLSTGRAKRLYAGSFDGAVKRTPEHPSGIVAALEPGDLIAYEMKGQICHVAVVVGKDPSGYVTIASHTSDRLFFPWDMGWNDSTVFWLLKVVY